MLSRIRIYHWAGPLFLLVYLIQVQLILPLERLLSSDQALNASYLFLPAGVKVVTFYVSRWRSLPSLFAGILCCYAWIYMPPGSSIGLIILMSLGSTLALPLGYWLACHVGGLDLFKGWRGSPHWVALLALVGLASIINGLALNYVWSSTPDPMLLLRFATGDVMGTLVLMLVAMFVMRRRRLNA